MTPFLLRVHKLGKTYDGHTWILKNLCLDLRRGDILGLLGKNGAGKSTLLKILSTAIAPSTGDAFLQKISISQSPEKARGFIGWADNQMGFYPQMTGLENLKIAAHWHRIPKHQFQTTLDLWSQCPTFQSTLQKPFSLCSTGMKQILSLFMTFAQKPQLFLFDESHFGLDQSTLDFLKFQIDEEKKYAAFIITSHSQSIIRPLANTLLKVENGQLV